MKYRASRAAAMGLLFALSIVLSFAESALIQPLPVPGLKIGLSNIVTFYCLFCMGRREAYMIAVLKSMFVLFTRGAVGAAMSLAGGLASVTVMLLLGAEREKRSFLFISVCGGLAHNAGQLFMAAAVLKSAMVFYYFPALALFGIAMGVLTGVLLRSLMPHFKRIFF